MQAEEVQAQETETLETGVKEVSKEELDKLIRYHVWGSIGVGLVPVPLIDFIALTGIQVNMLRKIAGAYNVPFFKDKAKNILTSLAGGALPTAVSGSLAASMSKAVPIMGLTAGIITMPVVAGATTYAIGKVFVQHFASGGTFLTFDPEKVKDYYAEMFKEGKKVAGEGGEIAKEREQAVTEVKEDKESKKAATKVKEDKGSKKFYTSSSNPEDKGSKGKNKDKKSKT